jgi:hypothetical protein
VKISQRAQAQSAKKAYGLSKRGSRNPGLGGKLEATGQAGHKKNLDTPWCPAYIAKPAAERLRFPARIRKRPTEIRTCRKGQSVSRGPAMTGTSLAHGARGDAQITALPASGGGCCTAQAAARPVTSAQWRIPVPAPSPGSSHRRIMFCVLSWGGLGGGGG